MNDISGKRVAYVTLGCKLNFSETSTIRRSLEAAGTVSVGEREGADIFVVNTCSVTDMAERKGRQLIRKIVAHNPEAYVVVVGCYAQLRAEELRRIPGVGAVLGAHEKFDVAAYLQHLEERRGEARGGCDVFGLKRFDPAYSFGDRTRCFLKIQDGCDYFCSYCTIPYARGRSRSATITQVAKTVREVAAKGVREVILTGVNTGDFGRGNGERFIDLLRELERLGEEGGGEGVERYRISSIEPNLLTEEVIGFVAGSRHFMPHFHVPLQSGSNEVLRLMRRRYDRELFAGRVDAIRAALPDAFIGVDVIVGMRGETRECFEEARAFIEGLAVSQLHVFPYSERQGTKALEIPLAVPQEEKHRRVGELLRISERKLSEFYRRFEGETRPVLFEESRVGEYICGFTDNYIRVQQPYDPGLANRIVPTKLAREVLRVEE